MLRWAVILVVLGLVAWAAGTMAEFPGTAIVTWRDWQVEASLGVFVAALLAIVAVVALLWRVLAAVIGTPKAMARAREERRLRLGLDALSRGFFAVATGDAETATKQSRRADNLLPDRPLPRLLAAQTAQLLGDDTAADREFRAMREQRETELLGLRGLLGRATQAERWDDALTLAERAYRLAPKTPWVVQTLYEAQKRNGRLADAEATLKQGLAIKALPAGEQAHLLVLQSEAGPGESALSLAKKAFKADPASPEAAIRYASLLLAERSLGRAVRAIEQAWSARPDPRLVELYAQATESHDALSKVKSAQRLATQKPADPESRIAVATAALEAGLWGEARSNLETLAGDDASPRLCRLMAELEEGEHADHAKARLWLMRASGERPEPLVIPPPAAASAAPPAVADAAAARA